MSKTYWQKKERDRRFQREMAAYLNFDDGIDGSGYYPTIRLEWKKSSYMLYFNWGGRERHVNIINACRSYCGRLTADKRARIEATMPATIWISTSCESYYSPGCPYNIGGYRYVHIPSRKDLQAWLGNI